MNNKKWGKDVKLDVSVQLSSKRLNGNICGNNNVTLCWECFKNVTKSKLMLRTDISYSNNVWFLIIRCKHYSAEKSICKHFYLALNIRFYLLLKNSKCEATLGI